MSDKRGKDGGRQVVRPEGRLDAGTAGAFRAEVRDLLDAGSRRLVVDMGGVSFLDSAGIVGIISSVKLVRKAGGDLRIARPSPQANMVLELTSLNKVLPVYSSLEDALAGFDG